MRFVFFNIPTSGHVNPTLPVATELVRRGHDVVYHLSEGYRERVQATGATYCPYETVAGIRFGESYFEEQFAKASERFDPALLATMLVDSADRLLPQLNRALLENRPDAVIYDSMCPWGRLAARAAALPAICSMSLLETPLPYALKSGVPGMVFRLLGQMVSRLPRYWLAARRLSRRHSMFVAPFPRILNWPGDRTICYSSRQIQPGSDRFGDDYCFVGPPIAPRPETATFPFELLNGQRSLIYISLGTVFNENVDFFRSAISAFADSPHQVVLSTGRRISPGAFGQLPPQIIARPFVPQLEILERASLFITHGGVNSVHEGLYYGVPLLLVPQQLEQATVAARIEELGAGLLLRPGETTADQLWSLSQRLLETPTYHRRAAELGEGLQAAGGAPRAADALEQWLRAADANEAFIHARR